MVVSTLTSPVVSAATDAVARLAMFASDVMSADPIAIAFAVPITATCVDVSAVNCVAVSAST